MGVWSDTIVVLRFKFHEQNSNNNNSDNKWRTDIGLTLLPSAFYQLVKKRKLNTERIVYCYIAFFVFSFCCRLVKNLSQIGNSPQPIIWETLD